VVTRVCHTCYLKMAGGLFVFDSKYDSLGSLLVIFLSVVGFVSLKYFYDTSGVVIGALLYL